MSSINVVDALLKVMPYISQILREPASLCVYDHEKVLDVLATDKFDLGFEEECNFLNHFRTLPF